MRLVTSRRLGWLEDGSLRSIRSALRQAAPDLADGSIVVRNRPVTTRAFFQGTAVVDEAYVVKFAWSEIPAVRLDHEAKVLRCLEREAPLLPVPRLVASLIDPMILVTRRVAGDSLDYTDKLTPVQRSRLATDLGLFLAALHDPALLGLVRAEVTGPSPQPQADTASIRDRFPRLIDSKQVALVLQLCDFADRALGPTTQQSVLHGDLHVANLVVEPQTLGLRLVADFEGSTVGDPNFDFRYLADVSGGVAFLGEVIASYETASSRRVDVRRVLGWHIRTMLGDALWRSEAAVPLPGGGALDVWVGSLANRMSALGFEVP